MSHLHAFAWLVQFSCSVVSSSLWPTWNAPLQNSLSITNCWNLLKLMSIELGIPSNRLILCCPCILLPSIFPTFRVFSSESVLYIRCQSIGVSASASVLSMNIQDWFPRMDWFDFFAVQGTFKSLLQHRSWKASILQCSAFFIVQLSHPCMTTGKTIALTVDLCWQSHVSAF